MEIMDISPIKLRVHSSISKLSESTNRKIKRKYDSMMTKASSMFAELIAPGQSDAFLAQMTSTVTEDELPPLVQDLKLAYDQASSSHVRRQILMYVVNEYTKLDIQNIFQCSKWTVDVARRMKAMGGTELASKEKQTRTKIDMERAYHFLQYVITFCLQDTAYGSKKIVLSTGKVLEIPAAIRTMAKQHTIDSYKEYCLAQRYDQYLSDSTLFSLLNEWKSSERRSAAGIDYFVAAGSYGFQLLSIIVGHFDPGKMDLINLRKSLKEDKHYLTTLFAYHCKSDISCTSHCATYALSDPNCPEFFCKCLHDHEQRCGNCSQLLHDLQAIQLNLVDLTETSEKEELIHDFDTAKVAILEWQRHILRGVYLDSMRPMVERIDEVLIIRDFMMKFLPKKFRESSKDWFGKRGITVHIDVVYMVVEGVTEKFVYITAVDNCDQDSSAQLSIFHHMLSKLVIDFPAIRNVYLKEDNASYYSSPLATFGEYQICSMLNIQLVKKDQNEPQRGKDECDRVSSNIKRHINSFVNEGNDVESAVDIKRAIDSHGGVRNHKTSVIETVGKQKNISVPGFSAYHNVRFGASQATFWKYGQIGNGRELPINTMEGNCRLIPFNNGL